MTRLTVFFSKLIGKDRRTHDEPVAVERRRDWHGGIKGTQKRVERAVEDLDRTVRLRQDDIERCQQQSDGANDGQQVVIFSTLQEVCRFRGSDALRVRLCRNANHGDAANTELAICDERNCPILRGVA